MVVTIESLGHNGAGEGSYREFASEHEGAAGWENSFTCLAIKLKGFLVQAGS